MKSCVVTCTGDRWELFALCKRWVLSQTSRPDLWLVATDTGEVPKDLPPWAWHLHVPSVPDNLLTIAAIQPAWALHWALKHVPLEHAAIIMEDDDWYSPQHVEQMLRKLQHGGSMVTPKKAWRCHLPEARAVCLDVDEPVEGWTGLHPKVIDEYADNLLASERLRFSNQTYHESTVVSIKGVGYGLPGRTGATRKHKPDHRKTLKMRPDPGHAHFRKAVGEEAAAAYLSLLKP